MTYKAQTFVGPDLKDIKGGYAETFQSNYQIQQGNEFRFAGLFGIFIVINVTVDVREGTIFLLVSPRVV